MVDSPFGPDLGEMDAGGMDAAAPMQPDVSPAQPKSKRLDALLALLSAGAMFAPMGRGAKGAAAALGLGGGLSLASGMAQAQKLKGVHDAAPGPDVVKIGSPGASMYAAERGGGEVQDEHTERERSLKQQLELWQKQLNKGGVPKKETQDEVNKLNQQLAEIAMARAAKAEQLRKDQQTQQTNKENAQKAIASEEARNNYRLYGGGAGLGIGALVALLSRNKLNKAVGSFEQTAGDIGKYTGERGNLLVSKGNAAPDLHAAINTAYESGGARPPLPSMSGIYGAETQKGLREAKGEFRAANEGVPTNAPFAPENVKKVSNLHPLIEKGIPAAAGIETAGTLGAAQATDNPDLKDALHNAAWMGGTGLVGYGFGRKVGSIFANAKPNDQAMRAVNAGRERMQKDAQTVGLKDLKTYAKATGDVATSNLPKPKGEFKPRDAAGMAELRDIKSTKGQARSDFIGNAHINDEIARAHAASIGPDGLVDRPAFRRAMRQLLGNQVQHRGQTVKIDDNFVRELLKAFGSR